MEIATPKGIEGEELEGTMRITRKWFSNIYIIMAVLLVIYLGINYTVFSESLKNGVFPLNKKYLWIIFWFWLSYYNLVGLLN